MSISKFYTLQMGRTGKPQSVMEVQKVSLTSKIYNSEIYQYNQYNGVMPKTPDTQ